MSGAAGARRMWDQGKQSHHIIAEGLKGGKWDELRSLMVDTYKLDLDDAANGVWLWRANGNGRLSHMVHRGNRYHSHAMSEQLYAYLSKAKNKEDFLNRLKDIRNRIEDGTWWIFKIK